MSNTYHHGKNFWRNKEEAYKNRALGYEFGSKRKSGYPIPGKFTKKLTHRDERRSAKKEIKEELYDCRDVA